MSAWSPLFPLLGFLMPEVGGGVLSHGGVITRELGIPASSSDQAVKQQKVTARRRTPLAARRRRHHGLAVRAEPAPPAATEPSA